MKFVTKIWPALVAAGTVFAIAGAAHAAVGGASSGSVQLKGNVSAFCTVDVKDLSVSLDLEGGEKNRKVAEIVETCNNGAGYDIRITSVNAGALKNRADNAKPISYQIEYDGQGGDLQGEMLVKRSEPQFGKQSDVSVSLDGSSTLTAGAYSDLVTIEIAAR